jgi:trimeric autotransporter adhesin
MRCHPLVLLVALLLLSTGPALGSEFVYHGWLERDGEPASGRWDVELRLYAERDAAVPIGHVTHAAVPVEAGAFAVGFELPKGSGDRAFVELSLREPGSAGWTVLEGREPVALAGTCPAGWALAGNAGTLAATDFLGTTDNQALVLRVNNQRALTLQPHATSPRVIAGHAGNTVGTSAAHGVVIAGGGTSDKPNRARANFAAVGGGLGNDTTGQSATVSGGADNFARGDWNTIGGGRGNETGALVDATVGGGAGNRALGQTSVVGGGFDNRAEAILAVIGGGIGNRALGASSVIAGGSENRAEAATATVGGGRDNLVQGVDATVGGGRGNVAFGPESTIAGGNNNSSPGFRATVGGGFDNRAIGGASTIVGGEFNRTRGSFSTVGGGHGNCAGGDYNWVGGRNSKVLLGTTDAPSEGACDWRSGSRPASARGVFLWADSLDQPWLGDSDNIFWVRATGGVRFGTAVHATQHYPTAGVSLAAGASSWGSLSDRNAKSDIAEADGDAVLDALVAMPMFHWRWTTEPEGRRHLGPMAQDFHAAFGLNGDDDRHILTIDGIGVALTATRALAQRVRVLEAEREANVAREAQLRAENAALAARVAALETSGAELARLAVEFEALRGEVSAWRATMTPVVATDAR